ncbi:DUF397 domain-containing protein [Streptomyces sp. NPDC087263]|uniref:DUF397 domain-containing protein n=1 Tax=Streptomyces sp. NPDC087263 TaxID=3365773 RepID=UPI00381AB7BA
MSGPFVLIETQDHQRVAYVEVAYAWRKSSYSSEQGGACLEVATSPHTIHIRDSKIPDDSPALAPATWTAFLTLARG